MKSLVVSLLLTSATITILPPSAIAQNPPAETFQPGFWQPVARANVDKPVTVKLINESGLILDYAITSAEMTPGVIKVGETTTLEDMGGDTYIVVYPDSKNVDSSRINLFFTVDVTEENLVNVKITRVEQGEKSHRAFNIQETGAIFLY